MSLTNIHRILYSKAAKHTFFSGAYGTSSKIGHILVHKGKLTNIMKLKQLLYLPDHNGIKLEINKRKYRKH
jgi:hypothetical protein